MKIKSSVIALIVLSVWALFSVVFIGWNAWQQFKANQATVAFNNGANQGYQKAIFDIAKAFSQKCEPLPLNLGKDSEGKDQSMEIIATACLQKPSDSAAPAAEKK